MLLGNISQPQNGGKIPDHSTFLRFLSRRKILIGVVSKYTEMSEPAAHAKLQRADIKANVTSDHCHTRSQKAVVHVFCVLVLYLSPLTRLHAQFKGGGKRV